MNRGFGTEKIEDDIKILFPEAAVARMDLDTTRTRSAYEKIIADFEQGKTDILIGTQMVSKGLDFDHVSIVGILNADTMLNYPDFRSYERAFQLMAQVAGRAGRKNKRGRVVLQTKSIEHPIIHQVIANDYEDMVGGQLAERQMFHYPPYYRLVYVYLKNHNEALLDQIAVVMADKLRARPIGAFCSILTTIFLINNVWIRATGGLSGPNTRLPNTARSLSAITTAILSNNASL